MPSSTSTDDRTPQRNGRAASDAHRPSPVDAAVANVLPSPVTAGDVATASVASATRPRSASASPPPSKKARTSKAASAGSRGVANLTAEQLAKKRANDREAQRAIRERTRNQIETLERRIEELTSQQPYQELQTALRQKELVEAENADIKRRLQAVLSIIQPLLEGSGMAGLSTPALDDQRSEYVRSSIAPAPIFPPNGAAATDPYSPSSVTTGGYSLASRTYSTPWTNGLPSASGTPTSIPTNVGARGVRISEPVASPMRARSSERMALNLLAAGGQPSMAAHTVPVHANGPADAVTADGRRISLPSDSHITLGMSPAGADEGMSPSGSMVHAPMSAVTPAPHAPGIRRAPTEPYGSDHAAPGAWSALPSNIAASCMLDSIFLDFLSERRRLAAQGTPELELIGPPYPDFTFFMLPSAIRKQRRAQHALSQLLTDIILTFPDIHASPEKVATYYGMYLALRWMALPTQANFDRMFSFIRPTAWQLTTPHPAWIDSVPWPAMRDELVKDYARVPFDEFFVPFTKSFSVNWPYPDEAVFHNGPPPLPPPDRPLDSLRELEIAPLFDQHIRDINNWSVGSLFASVYPALAPPGVRIEVKGDNQ